MIGTKDVLSWNFLYLILKHSLKLFLVHQPYVSCGLSMTQPQTESFFARLLFIISFSPKKLITLSMFLFNLNVVIVVAVVKESFCDI